MRLDHLLSTEFSGRRSGVRRVAHAPGIVSGGCGRAGVEEIVGFAGPWGRRGVVRICFWVPGPPPASVLGACGFPDAPGGTPWACGPRVGSGRGAWWFENWIVDASNAMM